MKNIRFLARHVPYKETTEYAVYFEHEGLRARLDWELADSFDGSHDHVADLMLTQIKADLEDEQAVAEIREQNKKSDGSRFQSMLDDGFVEHEMPEFKAKAVEMFGDS